MSRVPDMLPFKDIVLILLLVCTILLPVSSQYADSTAYVSQNGPVRLREALQNNTITTIVLKEDYRMGVELDDIQPIPITRNITLTSSPGNNFFLDQNYTRGKLELCPSCTFRFNNVTLVSDRRGKGILSFWSLNDMVFALGEGAKVICQDTYMLRHGCSTSKDTRQTVLITKRAAAFPALHIVPGSTAAAAAAAGVQHPDALEHEEQQFVLRDATLRGVVYPDSIHAIDYSIDAPLLDEAGVTTGGYAMHLLNSTRACQNTVAASCQLSPDACVNALVDAALRGEAAAAVAASQRRNTAVAIAVPIAAAVLIAAIIAAAWIHQKRRRKQQPAAAADPGRSSHKSGSGYFAADDDLESGMLEDACRDDFDSEGGTVVHRPFGLRKGWSVVNSQVAPHIDTADDTRIKFGELLGAGLFGRVYHGSWAGREAAIKVIQHTTETEEAVRREVELMLAFNHPNIVRAYHYVSYVRDPKASGPAHSSKSYTSPSSPSSAWGTVETTVDSIQSSDGDAGGSVGQVQQPAAAAGGSSGAEAVVVAAPRGGAAPKKVETWLVEEFCDLGTLGAVANGQWLPAAEGDEQMLQRLLLLQDCARGLQALHDRQVVHGDLNAQNVLVASNAMAQTGMTAKLADLGLSRMLVQCKTHRSTNSMGTLSHMPPELLKTGQVSAAVDVYSFGIMMWTLIANQPPFKKLHYGQYYEAICLQGLRPLIPANTPVDYKLLMEKCWSSDPADRPPVSRILQALRIMIDARTAACMERQQQQEVSQQQQQQQTSHQQDALESDAMSTSTPPAATAAAAAPEDSAEPLTLDRTQSAAAVMAAAGLMRAFSGALDYQMPERKPGAVQRSSSAAAAAAAAAGAAAATEAVQPAADTVSSQPAGDTVAADVEVTAMAAAAAAAAAGTAALPKSGHTSFSFGREGSVPTPEPTPTFKRPSSAAAAAATAQPPLPQPARAMSPFAIAANQQLSSHSDELDVQSRSSGVLSPASGSDGVWGRSDSPSIGHHGNWVI